MRILIADDDDGCRHLLRDILAPYGECILAENGSQALDLFRGAYNEETPFELVCLDIMMPDLDGQETLSQMRGIEKKLKVSTNDQSVIFMITALNSMQTVVSSFE